MRYLNYFEWDQGQCVWFIPHTSKGRNHPATWMENDFLSLLKPWEAWKTPARQLLYCLWERAWRFLVWKKNGGGALGISTLTGILGTCVSVPVCPLQRAPGPAAVLCSWATVCRRCPASCCRHGSALLRAQALVSLLWDSVIVQIHRGKTHGFV